MSIDRGPFCPSSAHKLHILMSIALVFWPVRHATMFTYTGKTKVYGPLNLPDESCSLTKMQQDEIESQSGLFVAISDSKEFGIWEGQRAPDNAGMLWP